MQKFELEIHDVVSGMHVINKSSNFEMCDDRIVYGIDPFSFLFVFVLLTMLFHSIYSQKCTVL